MVIIIKIIIKKNKNNKIIITRIIIIVIIIIIIIYSANSKMVFEKEPPFTSRLVATQYIPKVKKLIYKLIRDYYSVLWFNMEF